MTFLLALETSAARGSLALLRDGALLDERALTLPRRHNEELLAQVHALLSGQGIDTRALAAVAYGSGPGSFTGVRLAAAASLALSWAHELPCFAIDSAAALARQVWRIRDPQPVSVAVLIDARVGQVYSTWLSVAADGMPAAATTQLLTWAQLAPLAAASVEHIGIGDAWADARVPPQLRSALEEVVSETSPTARDVAAIAWGRWLAGDRPRAGAEQPQYLRGSDAWC